MSKNDIPNVDPVSSILNTEQAKNLTNPPSKSIGTALGDICDLCFGGLHEKAEKSRLIHNKHIEDFKKDLYRDVSNIPEENQVEPKKSIAGPALDASKYYFDEKEIRNMFERLIVNSMDNRMTSKVHPSFTEIIKQLSPLDAQNLALFRKKSQLPIIKLINKASDNFTVVFTNFFISNPDCQDFNLQSVSISSLNRLGLVDITYEAYFTDDLHYKPFLDIPFYQEYKAHFDNLNKINDDNHTLDYQKGIVSVTPLGKTFIDVCLSPLPNESNP